MPFPTGEFCGQNVPLPPPHDRDRHGKCGCGS
jgi:hypothetical protein